MTLQDGSLNYVNGDVIRRVDDARGDIIPVVGWTGLDLTRSHGMWQPPAGTAAAPLPARELVNQLLPSGDVMVMNALGAETASFTTRVAVNGTFLNLCTVGGTQTNGTLPAGILNKVGRYLKFRFWGTLGTNATPDYTVDLALGAAGANVLATTGAQTTIASSTPAAWVFEGTSFVQTAGATGKLYTCGTLAYANASQKATTTWVFGNSTVGTALTLDLTAAYLVTLNWTSSASHASNRTQVLGGILTICG